MLDLPDMRALRDRMPFANVIPDAPKPAQLPPYQHISVGVRNVIRDSFIQEPFLSTGTGTGTRRLVMIIPRPPCMTVTPLLFESSPGRAARLKFQACCVCVSNTFFPRRDIFSIHYDLQRTPCPGTQHCIPCPNARCMQAGASPSLDPATSPPSPVTLIFSSMPCEQPNKPSSFRYGK
jgi:hypothetical protein